MTWRPARGVRAAGPRRAALLLATGALALSAGADRPGLSAQRGATAFVGAQDPAWSPDGRRVAVSALDVIWTMGADGKQAAPLVPGAAAGVERDPVFSPDGEHVAFAADRGAGFDIYVAPARGGAATAVTTQPGDERWPSFTPDGRIVFARRAPRNGRVGPDPGAQWDLQLVRPVEGSSAWQAPVALTNTSDNETYPSVSPDGTLVAFVSEREADDDVDVWVMPLPVATATIVPLGTRVAGTVPEAARPPRPTRVVRAAGAESHLSWAPDSARLAFYGVRGGVGAVWVATVELPQTEGAAAPRARPKPAAPAQLVSRRAGAPAWSPDGSTLLVTGLPDPEPVYNGNPRRDHDEAPPLFAPRDAFQMWHVAAPAPVDEAGPVLAAPLASPRIWATTYERVWDTLRRLYYSSGPTAATWVALGEKYRPRAQAARTPAALEAVLDALVAEQPLIKPVVTSRGAMIVSGHPLASEAGRRVFERGGNIVDAMIAVSFALGVVEPEASGLGGDGSAVLFLKGMTTPTVVEYKDMTPSHATMDNRTIVRDGRIVGDGPAAANIPGVVAGLDHLYRHYGSGKVSWADLIAPAITLAEEGFILDAALPSSIAEGRRFIEKYPESARIFLPGGQVPQPGDRFVNKDYAATLTAIARDGADTFYRGAIARKIAADMEANGGIITYADLAQYRAMERAPVRGRYRGHAVFSASPPISTGIQLIESLQVLDRFVPRAGARTTTDADYFHQVIEAWKVRDPLRRVADPERWPVDYRRASARRSRGAAVCADQPGQGDELRAPRRRRRALQPAGHPHRAGHDGVRGRRCRREPDCRHADAQHLGRHVLRVQGPRLPLQQPPAQHAHDAGRLRQPDAVDALVDRHRPDVGVGRDRRRTGAAPGGRLRRQCLDSADRLQRDHQCDRRRSGGAGGHRGAALPARARSGRSAGAARAHRDRRPVSAAGARRPAAPRPRVPEDRPQGRSALRLRLGGAGRCRRRDHRRRRRAQALACSGRRRTADDAGAALRLSAAR